MPIKTTLIAAIMATGLVPLVASAAYKPYWFDNGPDPIHEGVQRIVDEAGRVGYATAEGEVVIAPRFAFGYPFKNGRAKVTDVGVNKEVPGSNGEYHYWESDSWYYIDHQGKRIAP